MNIHAVEYEGSLDMSDVVKHYYDESAEREWGRLIKDPYHMLEYIVTMYHIEKHLPERGLILDAGGGPGRYTIELAKRGYDIVLLDLSSKSLKVARREIRKARVRDRVVQIIEDTITDLSGFEDESFDAVLCLGPLSHILEVGDQQRAAEELVRVAKNGAPLIISVISLYGVLMVVLKRLTDELLNSTHKEMFTQGIHRAAWHLSDFPGEGFTNAKFYHPSELKEIFEEKGVETLEMATCEGLSCQHVEETNSLYEDPEKWARWLDILLKTCNDPVILGLSDHFLYIGKKL